MYLKIKYYDLELIRNSQKKKKRHLGLLLNWKIGWKKDTDVTSEKSSRVNLKMRSIDPDDS